MISTQRFVALALLVLSAGLQAHTGAKTLVRFDGGIGTDPLTASNGIDVLNVVRGVNPAGRAWAHRQAARQHRQERFDQRPRQRPAAGQRRRDRHTRRHHAGARHAGLRSSQQRHAVPLGPRRLRHRGQLPHQRHADARRRQRRRAAADLRQPGAADPHCRRQRRAGHLVGRRHPGRHARLMPRAQRCCRRPALRGPYTSFTCFSGRLRTGLPVAAWIAFSTQGATTQIVGSPTPPQKSCVGTITVSTFGISASFRIG